MDKVLLAGGQMAHSGSWESCISDSEENSTADGPGHPYPGWNGVKKLEDKDKEHVVLKHRFYSNIGPASNYCSVAAVYKNTHSVGSATVRLKMFQRCIEVMMEKRGGNANLKNAWYGVSKDGVNRIIEHGFECVGRSEDSNKYPFGLCLSTDGSTIDRYESYYNYISSAIDSVLSSVPDEDGFRHVIVCCVILGNTQVIGPKSWQSGPSSQDFDSGVDKKKSPKKYIIWPSRVQDHVLPLYVLSVKMEHQMKEVESEPLGGLTSPRMPLSEVLSLLAPRLPADEARIRRLHDAYMGRKITRQQLVCRVRLPSGDKLLLPAIRAFRRSNRTVRLSVPLLRGDV